jgi:hypothetical protein
MFMKKKYLMPESFKCLIYKTLYFFFILGIGGVFHLSLFDQFQSQAHAQAQIQGQEIPFKWLKINGDVLVNNEKQVAPSEGVWKGETLLTVGSQSSGKIKLKEGLILDLGIESQLAMKNEWQVIKGPLRIYQSADVKEASFMWAIGSFLFSFENANGGEAGDVVVTNLNEKGFELYLLSGKIKVKTKDGTVMENKKENENENENEIESKNLNKDERELHEKRKYSFKFKNQEQDLSLELNDWSRLLDKDELKDLLGAHLKREEDFYPWPKKVKAQEMKVITPPKENWKKILEKAQNEKKNDGEILSVKTDKEKEVFYKKPEKATRVKSCLEYKYVEVEGRLVEVCEKMPQ